MPHCPTTVVGAICCNPPFPHATGAHAADFLPIQASFTSTPSLQHEHDTGIQIVC